MRLKLIEVPDALWADPRVTDGAKLLWCLLRALGDTPQEFPFKALCDGAGLHLQSLHKCLGLLAGAQWLRWDRVDRNTIWCQSLLHTSSPKLILPSDLLFDHGVPTRAKWLWGVVGRLRGEFDPSALMRLTAYSQDSLTRYIRHLVTNGYLVGGSTRTARKTVFKLHGHNPHAARRAAEVRQLVKGLQVAKETPGYSQGQYILARYLLLMCPGLELIENAELTGLDNVVTGGRMHYDIYFPGPKVAVEFHGSQHAGPTALFPSQVDFQAQRQRDLIKIGRSQELGITLISMWARDLQRPRIHELLGDHIPLTEDLSDQWHLLDLLDRKAESYRRLAAQPHGSGH